MVDWSRQLGALNERPESSARSRQSRSVFDNWSPPDTPVFVCIDGSDDDHVELSFQNEGASIPPDQMPGLFEPFRGTTEHRGSRGLGLGLFITSQLVLAHDGSIEIDSSDAKGTVFTVRLPRKPRDA